ncbi:N-acetylmuramoyl-L-alanine amidase [Roseobacter sp. YSTF-M11]|uniref:N-acetylmuramoyl-L-alanine amidase n=1 Tax=Roseobacter insulae TaxID=2859783 RepID=A0A9X1FUV2_9RHOB|nr:N-acetylmuramoyl-L-alanine amidase [Roseobacter insulae]MBW4707809.1 N-acetylmuramoyl-L-alanine amidase [Roseobacter insulae]
MARFEIVPHLNFFSRKEWVTNTVLPRLGGRVDRSDRTHVFIHHTVTPDSDSTPNIWENEEETFARMRQLQVIRPELGLDVAYNFVAFIMANGDLNICEGRGEDRTGAHTKGHNTRAIAVSFAGNFEDLSVDGADLKGKMKLLSYFLGWLKFDPSHPDYGQFREMKNLGSLAPSGRKVFAHGDVKATACPGRKIVRHLDEVDFLDPKDA